VGSGPIYSAVLESEASLREKERSFDKGTQGEKSTTTYLSGKRIKKKEDNRQKPWALSQLKESQKRGRSWGGGGGGSNARRRKKGGEEADREEKA